MPQCQEKVIEHTNTCESILVTIAKCIMAQSLLEVNASCRGRVLESRCRPSSSCCVELVDADPIHLNPQNALDLIRSEHFLVSHSNLSTPTASELLEWSINYIYIYRLKCYAHQSRNNHVKVYVATPHAHKGRWFKPMNYGAGGLIDCSPENCLFLQGQGF